MNYDPGMFHAVDSVEHARQVILNPDGVHTTDERWEEETRWLIDKIATWLPPRNATCLDYGCGIGRLSKALIEERGWDVVGADISPSMLNMAFDYVKSHRFLGCAPGALDSLSRFGIQFDFAVTSWVLQHCERPEEDIDRIKRLVKPGGRIFVLNSVARFVPITGGWIADGADVWALLSEAFVQLRREPVPLDIVPAPQSFWGVFERVVS